MKKVKKMITALATSILVLGCNISAFALGFDINNDGVVNVNDVTFLQNEISNFNDNTDYDLNNDGRVDVNDISTLQIEISNNNIKNIEANTKLSVVTNEYKKNVGDTVTFSIITNNAISVITYSSSDSTVAKIVSSDKNMVKVKVNKVAPLPLPPNNVLSPYQLSSMLIKQNVLIFLSGTVILILAK